MRGLRRLRSSLVRLLPLTLAGVAILAPSSFADPSSPDVPAPAGDVRLPTLSPTYELAARALREGEYGRVRELLGRLDAESSGEASQARIVLGLAAHALERPAEAAVLLSAPPPHRGGLDDWRLWILADVEAARGRSGASLRALRELLTQWPDSVLAPRALVRAAEVAWEHGDRMAALRFLGQARNRDLPADLTERVAQLSWESVATTGTRSERREIARELLVEHPIVASEHAVIDLFRRHDGTLEWNDFLSPTQLLRRAESLIEAGVSVGALTTLDAVPESWRSVQWKLLRAEALTMQGEGDEALTVLSSVEPVNRADLARLEWMRARAALEFAEVVPGGGNPPSEIRDRYRRRALVHLDRTAELAVDQALAADALERLFVEAAAEVSFERSMEILRRLRRVRPDDETGPEFLWERGWREYADQNFSGAIGYWSELLELAPGSDYTRAGRYWTARAFDVLGHRERARAVYREVAGVPSVDFYARHAAIRLGTEAPPPRSVPHPAEPWPVDPLLRRARLLSDLGLDRLALVEIELLEEEVSPRAAAALRGLVRARASEPRRSIRELRRAFPALGTTAQARVPRAALELYYPLLHTEAVDVWATRHRLPNSLVFGVIRQESAFDAAATSWAGARGLMQIMPATARELAQRQGLRYWQDRLYEPEFSLRLGTSYLRQMLDMFDGSVELALAGYNGGPYRIKRLWREAESSQLDAFIEGLHIEEPRTYVKRILLWIDSYERLYPEAT